MSIGSLVFGTTPSPGGAKPINTDNNNLKSSRQVIRKVDIAQKFKKEQLKKDILRGGTPTKTVITKYKNDTVDDKGNFIKAGTKLKTKTKLDSQDIMRQMKEKWAGKTVGEFVRSTEKNRGFEYKDEQGKEVKVSLDAEGRRKYENIVGERIVGLGETPEQAAARAKKEEGLRHLHILETQRAREKKEKSMAAQISKKHEKLTDDEKKRQRMNEGLDRSLTEGSGAEKRKVTMGDIGVVNRDEQESTVGVNVEKSQAGGAGSVETGGGAAGITAAIGVKAPDEYKGPGQVDEGQLEDPFETVINRTREQKKVEAKQKEDESRRSRKILPDDGTRADDYGERRAA